MRLDSPLCFSPVYKDYLWGGSRISELYKRINTPVPCAESWEISAHPDGMSIVSQGEFKGISLAGIAKEYPRQLLGADKHSSRFPLLVKLIDAKRRLSVQVHPNEETAARHGGEAKSEMWYVLDATEGAGIYAGFKKRITPEEFLQSLENKNISGKLARLPVKKGDAIYIPGGTVHAIAEGCLILEVQQNSNTTYRVYDWEREGPPGKPRALHIEEAIRVINWDLTGIHPIPPVPMPGHGPNRKDRVLECDYFSMHRLQMKEAETIAHNGSCFSIIFVEEGSANISSGNGEYLIPKGGTCLIPACAHAFTVTPNSPNSKTIIINPE